MNTKRTRIIALILPALLAMATMLHAADYHVSTAGNNSNNGSSPAQAWRTLQHALTQVPTGQGHTIHLAVGTYEENLDMDVGPGINIQGAGLASTHLVTNLSTAPSGSGEANQQWFLRLHSTSAVNGNQKLSGFSIDGNGNLYGGLSIMRRNHVTVEDVRISNTWLTGLEAWSGVLHSKYADPSVWLTGLIIDGVVLENCARQFQNFTSGAMHVAGLEGAVIRNCTVLEPLGYGIKQRINGSFGWFRNVDIHDNVILNSGTDKWGSTISIELFNVQNGNRIFNNSTATNISLINKHWEPNGSDGILNVEIFGNEIGDPASADYKSSAGVEIAAPDILVRDNVLSRMQAFVIAYSLANNVEIRNNIFYDTRPNFYPIQLRPNKPDLNPLSFSQYGVRDWRIFNNTFDSSSTGGCIRIQSSESAPAENVEVRNNIFRNTGTQRQHPAQLLTGSTLTNGTFTHNYFQNRSSATGGFTFQNNYDSLLEPGLHLAGGWPDPYYRPTGTGSNVVNAGTNVGLPFSGSAPDLGAIDLNAPPFWADPVQEPGFFLFDDALATGWSIRNNVGIVRLSADGYPTHAGSAASIQIQANNAVRLETSTHPEVVHNDNRFITLFLYWDSVTDGELERLIMRFDDASQLTITGGHAQLYLDAQPTGSGPVVLPSRQWVSLQFDMGVSREGASFRDVEVRANAPALLFVDDVSMHSALVVSEDP